MNESDDDEELFWDKKCSVVGSRGFLVRARTSWRFSR